MNLIVHCWWGGLIIYAKSIEPSLLGQKDLFETHQRDELQRIADWVAMGPIEGIRQEMLPSPNPLVWDLVNADSSVCSSKRCTDTAFTARPITVEMLTW